MNDDSSKTLESMSLAGWYNNWVKNNFSKYLSGSILEIGCGIGNFSSFLSNYGSLTAIDINKDYVKEAQGKIGQGVEVGLGDIEKGNYFFKDRKFNTIVCLNVLEHIKDDRIALENVYKLLAKNGYLILLVPAHQILYNSIDKSIGHYRRYEKDKLIKLLKDCNFEIVKDRRLNFFGGIGWFIAGKLFKDSQVSEGKIKIFNLIGPLFITLENIFEPPFGTSLLLIAKRSDK